MVIPQSTPKPLSVLVLGMEDIDGRPSGPNRYVSDMLNAAPQPGMRGVQIGVVRDQRTSIISVTDEGSRVGRLLAYRRALDRAATDVAVVNSHFALYGLLALTSRLRSRPIVSHFHGPWAQESAVAGESFLKVQAKYLIERAVYSRSEHFVTLSHAFKNLLVHAYGIPPWSVSVIPPGVDLGRFSPGDREAARRRLSLPLDRSIVISVRRLTPRTGIRTLLTAWQSVVHSTDGALLLLAGDGADRDRLVRATRQLGIAGSVSFLGHVGDEALADLYRAADLSVIPSARLEGFGLAALESLAAGTPVIAFDVGGLAELLGPLDRSLVVPANDAPALAQRIARALGPVPALPSRARCRQIAEGYSWASTAKQLQVLFNAVASGPAKRRPRLVIIDHCALLSGAELQLLQLLPALAHQLDIHVVLGEDGPLSAALRAAHISVEILPIARDVASMRRRDVRPGRVPTRLVINSLTYTRRLARRLRQLHPDIVQTNSLKAHILGTLATRFAKLPLVWHLHDRIADDYLPSPAVRMVRLASRHASAIVANSMATAETLHGCRTPDVIPYVIAPKFTRPPRDGSLRGRAPRFVMVGRIQPWKGQHIFLAAFAHAFSASDVTGVIVGSPLFGEDQYLHDLRAQCAELGIASRVTFAGFTDHVEEHLAQADCLVHASTIPEPFGQVIVEAMAAGLPVIASGAGGPSEIIQHGVNGLLFQPGDREALAAAMNAIAGDSHLRRVLSANGCTTAARFAPTEVAGQMLAVYSRVLGDGPSRLVAPTAKTASHL